MASKPNAAQTEGAKPESEKVQCEPADVAAWIGLDAPELLGPQPIILDSHAVVRLQAFGGRAELSTFEAAAILHANRQHVTHAAKVGNQTLGIKLGHRKAAGRIAIAASDLALWIKGVNSPPVRATHTAKQVTDAELDRQEAEIRKRHNLY